jgi:hypothetical protein
VPLVNAKDGEPKILLGLERGRDFKIPDWIGDVTSTCPRANSPGLADACATRCPGLLEIG